MTWTSPLLDIKVDRNSFCHVHSHDVIRRPNAALVGQARYPIPQRVLVSSGAPPRFTTELWTGVPTRSPLLTLATLIAQQRLVVVNG